MSMDQNQLQLAERKNSVNTELFVREAMSSLLEKFNETCALYVAGLPLPSAMQPPPHRVYPTDELTRRSMITHVKEEPVSSDTFSALSTLPASSSVIARIGCFLSPFIGRFSFSSGLAPQQVFLVPSRSIGDAHAFFPLRMFLEPFFGQDSAVELPCSGLCRVHSPDARVQWVNCEVFAYDPATRLFRVKLEADRNGISREKDASRGGLVLSETIEEHESLVQSAMNARHTFEQRLRLELYLDMVPDDACGPPLPDTQLRRILRLATRGLSPHDAPMVTTLVDAIRKEYSVTMRQIRFQYFALSPLNRQLVAPLDLHFEEADEANAVKCVTSHVKQISPGSNRKHVAQMRKILSASLPWRNPSMKCLMEIRNMWFERLWLLTLVDCPTVLRDVVPFDEFTQRIMSSIRAGRTVLQVRYISDLDRIVTTTLHTAYSYSFLSVEDYLQSELARLFTLIRVEMTRRLRELATRSLKSFAAVFARFSGEQSSNKEIVKPDDAETSFYHIEGENGSAGMLLGLRLEMSDRNVKCIPELSSLAGALTSIIHGIVEAAASVPRLENVIMSSLDLPPAFVPCVSADEVIVTETEVAVQTAIRYSLPILVRLEKHCNSLAQSEFGFGSDDEYFPSNGATALLEDHFTQMKQRLEDVARAFPQTLFSGVFAVRCSEVKQRLVDLWSKRIENLQERLEKRIAETVDACATELERISKRLKVRPASPEEIQALQQFMEGAVAQLASIENIECQKIVAWVSVSHQFCLSVPPALMERVVAVLQMPQTLHTELSESNELMQRERKTMIDELSEFRDSVTETIKIIEDKVEDLNYQFEAQHAEESERTVKAVRAQIEKLLSDLEILHRREAIFSISSTCFWSVPKLIHNFEPFEQFWTTFVAATNGIQRFLEQPVSQLAAEKMADSVSQWRLLLRAATRCLRGFPELENLGRTTEIWIAKFQETTEALAALRGPGIRVFHWKELSKRMELPPGKELLPTDQTLTVQRLIQLNISRHYDLILELASAAEQEYEIQRQLGAMHAECRSLHFIFETRELESGKTVQLLANGHELLSVLEHFVVTTQQLAVSPFVGVHGVQLAEWESLAIRMQETLSRWLEIQEHWLQLMPIMEQSQKTNSVDDDSGLVFASADKDYRTIIDDIVRQQQTLLSIISHELLPLKLSEIHATLQAVRSAVMSVMDAKRAVFPRLYFVANQDLLSCLSHPNTVSTKMLLPKIYYRFVSTEISKNEVCYFVSSDGVKIRNEEPISVSQEPLEHWLKKLDHALHVSLVVGIENCMKHYASAPLRNWVVKWSSQLVDLVAQIKFTEELTEVLDVTGNKGLLAYSKKMNRVVQEYLVASQSRGAECPAISTALVGELHRRDVVDTMIAAQVCTAAQARTYPFFQVALENSVCTVSLLCASHSYSFEFLGNYVASVVTASEFLAKRAVFFSLVSQTGPLVAGSPSTGKTHLISDLALQLGRFYWGAQCLSETKISELSSVLRGCLCIGAWLCLEDVEQLSHDEIAYLLQLAKTIRQSADAGMPYIETPSGAEWRRNSAFALLCTTRSHTSVPAALQSVFRPVHLHRPDFVTAARILICSYGLSSEVHSLSSLLGCIFEEGFALDPATYHIGRLREVVLAASETMKNGVVNTPAAAIHFALRNVAVSHDKGVMKRICRGLEELLSVSGEIPVLHVEAQLKVMMLHFRHIILLGATFSGKSSLIEKYKSDPNPIVIDPHSISAAALYGSSRVQGVLSWLLAECCQNPRTVIFDGCPQDDILAWNILVAPIPRVWSTMETEHTAIDPGTAVYFKTTSIRGATPRVVAHCGLLCTGEAVAWQTMFSAQKLSEIPEFITSAYQMSQFALLVVPFLIDKVTPLTNCSPQLCIARALFIAERILPELEAALPHVPMRELTLSGTAFGERQVGLAIQALAFGLLQSFGGLLSSKDRRIMNSVVALATEAINPIQANFDAELLPSKDPLDFWITPLGWKKVITDEILTEAKSSSVVDPQNLACDNFCKHPEIVWITHFVGSFAKLGISIVLDAERDSGASAFLRGLALVNDGPFTYRLAVSKGLSCRLLETEFLKKCAKRKAGVYGPHTGKNLILCVDDLHLGFSSGKVQPSSLTEWIYYMSRYQKAFMPKVGIVSLADTSVVAVVKNLASLRIDNRFARAFLSLKFPRLSPLSLENALRSILEASALAAGLQSVGRHVAEFLSAVQHAMTEQKHHLCSFVTMFHAAQAACTLLRSSITERSLRLAIASEVIRVYTSSIQEEEEKETVSKAVQAIGIERFDIPVDAAVRDIVVVLEESTADCVTLGEARRRMVEIVNHYNEASRGTRSLVVEQDAQPAGGASSQRLPTTTDGAGSKVEVQPPIVPTTWFIDNVIRMVLHLQQPSTSVALVGTYTSGMHQLAKFSLYVSQISCCYVTVCDDLSSGKWRSELQKIVCAACRKESRVGIVLQLSCCRNTELLQQLNTLLSMGSISSLFDDDELSSIFESIRLDEKVDAVELVRQRLKHQLRLVLLVPSFAVLEQLQTENPFVTSMIVQDVTVASEPLLMQDFAEKYCVKAFKRGYSRMKQDDRESLSEASVAVFQALRSQVQFAKIESDEFLGFLQITLRLFQERAPQVRRALEQHEARVATMEKLRADVETFRVRKDQLAPSLNAMIEEIAVEEEKLAKLSTDVDAQKEAFNSLETRTVAAVSVIEARKHMAEQMVSTAVSAVSSARLVLKELDIKHITNLRLTLSPPVKIKLVMEAMCILMGEKPEKPARGAAPDYWSLARCLLEDQVGFIARFCALPLDRHALPPQDKLKPCVEMCNVNRFTSVSLFAQAVADYVVALYQWIGTDETVSEIEAEVIRKRAETVEAVGELEAQRDHLQRNTSSLAELRDHLDTLRTQRNELQTESENCERSLQNTALVVSLSQTLSELWEGQREDVHASASCLKGNVCIAAACVSFLGPLPEEQADAALDVCRAALKQRGIPFSPNFSIHSTVASDRRILLHEVSGINYPLHIEGALVAAAYRCFARWPLFVTDSDFFFESLQQQLSGISLDCRTVEFDDEERDAIVRHAMTDGAALIVQNFHGTFDPSWDSVLNMLPYIEEIEDNESLDVSFANCRTNVRKSFYLVFVARSLSHVSMQTIRNILTPFVVDCSSFLEETILQTLVHTKASESVVPEQAFTREAKQFEDDKLKSMQVAEHIISTHREKLVASEGLISEVSNEIRCAQEADAQMGDLLDKARHVSSIRRGRWDRTVPCMLAAFRAIRRMMRLCQRSAPNIPVVLNLVQRSFSLNKAVSAFNNNAKLDSMTADEQQRWISVAFLQSVIDVFAPVFSTPLRQVALAIYVILVVPNIPEADNAGALTHDSNHEELTPEHADFVEQLLDFKENCESTVEKATFLATCAEKLENSSVASLRNLATCLLEDHPPTKALSRFIYALLRNDKSLPEASSQVVITYGGWSLPRQSIEKGTVSCMQDIRIDRRFSLFEAECSKVPIVAHCSDQNRAMEHIAKLAAMRDSLIFMIDTHAGSGELSALPLKLRREFLKFSTTSRISSSRPTWLLCWATSSEVALSIDIAASVLTSAQFSHTADIQLWILFHETNSNEVKIGSLGVRCIEVNLDEDSLKRQMLRCNIIGVGSREWREESSPLMRKLLQAVIFFYFALLERERCPHQWNSISSLCEIDMTLVLKWLKQGAKKIVGESELIVDLRRIASILFAARCTNASDVERIFFVAPSFIHKRIMSPDGYHFGGAVAAEDIPVAEILHIIERETDEALEGISGDLSAKENIEQSNYNKCIAVLEPLLSGRVTRDSPNIECAVGLSLTDFPTREVRLRDLAFPEAFVARWKAVQAKRIYESDKMSFNQLGISLVVLPQASWMQEHDCLLVDARVSTTVFRGYTQKCAPDWFTATNAVAEVHIGADHLVVLRADCGDASDRATFLKNIGDVYETSGASRRGSRADAVALQPPKDVLRSPVRCSVLAGSDEILSAAFSIETEQHVAVRKPSLRTGVEALIVAQRLARAIAPAPPSATQKGSGILRRRHSSVAAAEPVFQTEIKESVDRVLTIAPAAGFAVIV